MYKLPLFCFVNVNYATLLCICTSVITLLNTCASVVSVVCTVIKNRKSKRTVVQDDEDNNTDKRHRPDGPLTSVHCTLQSVSRAAVAGIPSLL